ncbi:hypothetical protein A4X09_0g5217 [Tilletia walkeri]|uniref:Uncharacterized protein n=1 Tax=Tilletia walkeri TaxID=117179 RepID=A0A8X7N6Y5_9BASI|nr:hypothetical protein A4X09_0g5217 [Tilletia walkeri]
MAVEDHETHQQQHRLYRRASRPSSIASTSTLTLTSAGGSGPASASHHQRISSTLAPKLDLISAVANTSRTGSASTSTSSDFALASAVSSPSTTIASSSFDHITIEHSNNRPRPSSTSTYSFSTTSTSAANLTPTQLLHEHSRMYASPSTTAAPSAEASLLAAKLRLSRSASLESGSRSDPSTYDNRPGASSGQRSSFYGTAMSGTYNGSQDYARPVQNNDVFAPGFTRVVHAAEHGDELSDRTSSASTPASSAVASTSSRARSGSRSGSKGKQASEPVLVRYILPYGLSGPAVEKNYLNEALLAPAFEVGAAEPTLASALAGSSSSSSTANPASSAASTPSTPGGHHHHHQHNLMYPSPGAASGSYPMNDWMFGGGIGPTMPLAGPNAVPLHLVHGLTNLSSDNFPLDAAELAAYETGMPVLSGGDAGAGGAHHHHAHALSSNQALAALQGDMEGMSLYPTQHMVDPRTLRAIALTSQAAAVYRSHTVTRRFRDPFRESMERIARRSGRLPSEGSDGTLSGIISPSGTISGRHSPAQAMLHSGRMSPHPRRGTRTEPGSPSSVISGGGAGMGGSASEMGGLGIGGLRSGYIVGGGGGGGQGRPGLNRANTGDYPSSRRLASRSSSSGVSGGGGLFTGLVDVAEHPVRSLKRVWSGGLHRGVFGMTKADDGAGGGQGQGGGVYGGQQGRQGRTSLR